MGFLDKIFGKSKATVATAVTSTSSVTNSAAPAPGGINLEKGGRINLMKERVNLLKGICLAKGIDYQSRVAFNIDVSGSMENLYLDGTVQNVFERLFPIAMQFDDNQAIDLFAFHHEAFDIGEINLSNFHGCIKTKITDKYRMGGTNYAPIIRKIVNRYKNEPGDPVYVIFITDGDCGDPLEAERAMKDASHYGIFFQFVGIGNASMSFLERLDEMPGRKVDNANFFQIRNINTTSDADLYGKMMVEYPSYITEAKRLNII